MKNILFTTLIIFVLGFGAKGQYVYSYSGETKPAWHNEDRKITININVTLDSILNKGGTHYGIYFSYDIKFKYNNQDITSQMPTYKRNKGKTNFFNNLRLRIGCDGTYTDVGLIPLINTMGFSGNGLADRNQYLNGISNPTIEKLWCNKIKFEIGFPGLVETRLHENTTLPIELIEFNANSNNQQVELNWSTASELNNDYFTIERSADGMNWEIVQTIEGAGNSSRVLDYTWTDYAPFAGISYYRLTQTDFNGDSETFDVLSVVNNELKELQASPNPTVGLTTLTGLNQNTELYIYNSMGVDVSSNVIISSNGIHTVLDMSQLSKGMYFVRNGEQNLRLVKK